MYPGSRVFVDTKVVSYFVNVMRKQCLFTIIHYSTFSLVFFIHSKFSLVLLYTRKFSLSFLLHTYTHTHLHTHTHTNTHTHTQTHTHKKTNLSQHQDNLEALKTSRGGENFFSSCVLSKSYFSPTKMKIPPSYSRRKA